MGILSSWGGLFFTMLWFVLLNLPQLYGITALMWILPAGQLINMVIQTAVNLAFVHKKVVPIKIAWWQTLGIPLVVGGIMLVYYLCLANFVLYPLIPVAGFFVAVIVTVFLAIEGFLMYFGLTALLGGWDDDMINEFEQAARMSDPSKFMTMPLFWITRACARRSKLHGRYSISSASALQEALELYADKLKK
jgi:hypothetical protein